MKYAVFFMCRTIKILISNWPRKLKFSKFYRQGRLTFLTKVTRWSRSTSNFYAGIGQNLTGEFMRKIYAASWNLFTLTAEADRVLCQLEMFLTVFFHWMYKMKLSCYQESSVIHGWLVCLLDFWLRNTSLVKVGNPISYGIVFAFHLAGCVRGLKSLKWLWPYLIVFSGKLSFVHKEETEHSFELCSFYTCLYLKKMSDFCGAFVYITFNRRFFKIYNPMERLYTL